MSSVVICAFDGLQPSQVTPKLMPKLAQFAAEGVFFCRHHPVFPSVTRLNAASMVTGCYPATHGIAGNRMVFRDVDPQRMFEVLEPQLREVDAATGGRILLVPTLGERLAAHGLQQVSVVSGTSGNAYCHNPNAARAGGAVTHPDFCLPDGLYPELEARYGAWPDAQVPNVPRLRHATKLLLEYAVGEVDAAVSFIWYSEPDISQHAHGPGSPQSEIALMHADEEFGKLLEELETSGRVDETDVLVVSDHGYSTVIESIDVEDEVHRAGFPAGDRPGGVTVASNGGAVLFYVYGGDAKTATRLFDWLVSKPWCGPVFAAERVGSLQGVLPAALIGVDGPRGPDLAVSMQWDRRPNEYGYPGHAYTAGGHAAGEGDHGSMSQYEMRNTLIARGPGFRSGASSDLPTGNVDLAPTVLRLLGLPVPDSMDGRVLEEALTGSAAAPDVPDARTTTHTAEARVEGGIWRQSVTVTQYEGVDYVDEGSSTLEPN